MLKYKSKKAQAGEAVTWIVATIVIIGILLIFTFISSVFAQENGMVVSFSRVFSNDELTNVDWVQTKTNLAFGLNSANKDFIENWIKEIKNE